MKLLPPSVDKVRRRLLEEGGEEAARLGSGLLSRVCRLALRPASLDEVAAEADELCVELLGEPSSGRLGPLLSLVAGELYGLGDAVALADAAETAARWMARRARRVWLCRGQSLTLVDGRRLDELLRGAGLEVAVYGATNRCRPAEISPEPGSDDILLEARSGAFRLTGFVEHPDTVELVRVAEAARARVVVLLDDWREPVEAPRGTSVFVIPVGGERPGLAFEVDEREVETADEETARSLFSGLRRSLGLEG